jgi:hypothetical protein
VLGAAYYFRRDGVTGLVSGKGIPDYAGTLGSSTASRVAVLAVNGQEQPKRIAAAAGVMPRHDVRPRLMRRYRYTSIYEVLTER